MAKPQTLAEWQEAYEKLEEKLGKQGEELGAVRKQAKEFEGSLNDYVRWSKEAAPIVDWYSKNETEVKRRWDAAERPAQATPVQQAVEQQAGAIAQQDPRFQWLTPQEKQAFVGEISQHLSQSVLQPWTQQFTKQVQEYAQQQRAQVDAQNRSHADVLWRTLQFVLPPEKLKEAAAMHQEALKYADHSKLDPMAMAQDALAKHTEIATLKAQVADYEKKTQDRDKMAAPSILGGAPPEAGATSPARAATKDDRFTHVMDAVKAEHGPDGAHALFGPQGNPA